MDFGTYKIYGAEVTCIIIFLYRSFNLDSDYRYQLSHFLPFCDLMISTNFISLSYFRVLFNAYEISTCTWRYPGFLLRSIRLVWVGDYIG